MIASFAGPYDALPSRADLAGDPDPELTYRDPAHPGLVFRALVDGRSRRLREWQAFGWRPHPG